MRVSRPALPDLIIGGAPRSGTTFLGEVLAKHPDVFVARPMIPEPKVLFADPGVGDAGILARYAAVFADAPDDSVRIEKTSNYLESEIARIRFGRLLLKTRMLFILRDPIARAYSNWRWSRKNGLEVLSFTEALSREGRRSDPFNGTRPHARPFDYLARSRYGSLALRWIELVGRDRLCFVTLEDALENPERFVEKVQAFVGIRRLPWSALATGPINCTQHSEPLSRELMAVLRKQLQSEMMLLESCAGVEVSRWGY